MSCGWYSFQRPFGTTHGKLFGFALHCQYGWSGLGGSGRIRQKFGMPHGKLSGSVLHCRYGRSDPGCSGQIAQIELHGYYERFELSE